MVPFRNPFKERITHDDSSTLPAFRGLASKKQYHAVAAPLSTAAPAVYGRLGSNLGTDLLIGRIINNVLNLIGPWTFFISFSSLTFPQGFSIFRRKLSLVFSTSSQFGGKQKYNDVVSAKISFLLPARHASFIPSRNKIYARP